jgi:hypothetical protein
VWGGGGADGLAQVRKSRSTFRHDTEWMRKTNQLGRVRETKRKRTAKRDRELTTLKRTCGRQDALRSRLIYVCR